LLAGVTVLDLSTVGPAARCTRLLADYGATVVKVGAVPGRGPQPITPPFYAYSGSRWLQRIAINLKDPDGHEAFMALARKADVVVESFRPGVVDRLGIGYAALTEANPGIILCSTTGFGQSGPRADWVGHDINYLAVGGYLASSQPRADGGPPIAGATLADAAGGGMQAAMAIMAVLIGRRRTGVGAHLDVSIADGVLWLTSLAVDEHLATGAEVGPGTNILSGRFACYDTYRAADGKWLAVGAIEPKFFANLCERLGLKQWVSHQLDDEVQDKIRAEFGAAFAARDRDEWVEELVGFETCVSPVQSVAELVDDEQYRARGAVVDVVMDGVDGPRAEGMGDIEGPLRFRQVGPVLAGMVRPDGVVRAPYPEASETDSLLEAAGIPPERIAELRTRGVVA
jgi:alpha-methylacyl-CoA racemase